MHCPLSHWKWNNLEMIKIFVITFLRKGQEMFSYRKLGWFLQLDERNLSIGPFSAWRGGHWFCSVSSVQIVEIRWSLFSTYGNWLWKNKANDIKFSARKRHLSFSPAEVSRLCHLPIAGQWLQVRHQASCPLLVHRLLWSSIQVTPSRTAGHHPYCAVSRVLSASRKILRSSDELFKRVYSRQHTPN